MSRVCLTCGAAHNKLVELRNVVLAAGVLHEWESDSLRRACEVTLRHRNGKREKREREVNKVGRQGGAAGKSVFSSESDTKSLQALCLF